MGTSRLEAFSDGVIAIIITIMVLELKAPADPSIAALLHLWPTLLSYLLSFLLVAIYWLNHHHLIHMVRRVDSLILWLNMNLLFWMSLTPFAAAYLGEQRATPISVALYGGLQAFCCLAFALLRHGVARREFADPRLLAAQSQARVKIYVALGIYISSIVAAFVSTTLALLLIATPAVMYFLPAWQGEKEPG